MSNQAELTEEQVKDWISSPVTKSFFKSLVRQGEDLKLGSLACYDRDNPLSGIAKFAELNGQVRQIESILRSYFKEPGFPLVNPEDILEVLNQYEQGK